MDRKDQLVRGKFTGYGERSRSVEKNEGQWIIGDGERSVGKLIRDERETALGRGKINANGKKFSRTRKRSVEVVKLLGRVRSVVMGNNRWKGNERGNREKRL